MFRFAYSVYNGRVVVERGFTILQSYPEAYCVVHVYQYRRVDLGIPYECSWGSHASLEDVVLLGYDGL